MIMSLEPFLIMNIGGTHVACLLIRFL